MNRTAEDKAAREAKALEARAAAVSHLRATGAGDLSDSRQAPVSRAVTDNTLKLMGQKLFKPSTSSSSSATSASSSHSTRAAFPLGWETALDSLSGKYYYYHTATKQTSWILPQEGDAHSSDTSSVGQPIPSGWYRASTAEGVEYFYSADRLSTWERPSAPPPGHSPSFSSAAATQSTLSIPPPAPQWPEHAPGSSSSSGSIAVFERIPSTVQQSQQPVPFSSGSSSSSSSSSSSARSRGGVGGGHSFTIRGRGGVGGFHHRKPYESSALDPLDPTGTGGKWSDGLDFASGKPSPPAPTASGEPARVRAPLQSQSAVAPIQHAPSMAERRAFPGQPAFAPGGGGRGRGGSSTAAARVVIGPMAAPRTAPASRAAAEGPAESTSGADGDLIDTRDAQRSDSKRARW